MKVPVKRSFIFSTVFSALLLSGCSGGGSGSAGTGVTSGGSSPVITAGIVGVSLTDAPSCGFDAVNVTITKIRIHKSEVAGSDDAGWREIVLNPSRRINLLDLTNGVSTALGELDLEPGRYNHLRLMLDPNTGNGLAHSVIPSGSANEVPLEVPSAFSAGIKLKKVFDVVTGQRTDLVVDFDACDSVLTRGAGVFALTPVIKAVPPITNGIIGFVSQDVLKEHVRISAQQNGQIIGSTMPDKSGRFFLSRLTPGLYDIVITADNRPTSVVTAVPVADTSSTVTLGSAGQPIAPPVAATEPEKVEGKVAVNQPSLDAIAYATAKQTFASGETVTVKYKRADLADGTYELARLPTVAPLLATYKPDAPLAFTAQGDVLPGVGKYAVQVGAPGYVATAPVTVDVILRRSDDTVPHREDRLTEREAEHETEDHSTEGARGNSRGDTDDSAGRKSESRTDHR